MTRLAPLVVALAALTACSGYEEEQPVEAVSQSEAEALDDAAEMIEQRRLPEDLLPTGEDDAAADTGEGRMPAKAAPRESGGPEPMELPNE